MNFREHKEEIRNWIKNNIEKDDYILIGKNSINLTGYFDSGRVNHAEISEISEKFEFRIILDGEEPIFEIDYEDMSFIFSLIKFLYTLKS
ncbi:Uncharacterised protein [Sebaldella termitidis]|uniref:Uncharacterized protein n=1 Tax=Sebaldella termitidis (strain ATCC 33386 / NCTC 11300) TaxID=526218 RepID=D1ANB6_SEBTE|nr:hypothetical protein [Sebaldella termitidis]ACZ07682.1 hypothetical protein Sterm_0810 [Sebaldella termitidis ATCC 33386]ACZ09720.1 hypothetical protein Sterm_2876 [Sebaldella termitidis ATCC 33386]SUI22978.1 Uncharacterised protein [Sebaldella termitidis]SUI25051.1 Uncharacterised protein [Sebaldella termitidis]